MKRVCMLGIWSMFALGTVACNAGGGSDMPEITPDRQACIDVITANEAMIESAITSLETMLPSGGDSHAMTPNDMGPLMSDEERVGLFGANLVNSDLVRQATAHVQVEPGGHAAFAFMRPMNQSSSTSRDVDVTIMGEEFEVDLALVTDLDTNEEIQVCSLAVRRENEDGTYVELEMDFVRPAVAE